MKQCVSCGNTEPLVAVGTGGCGCVNGGGEVRAVKLMAPTRDTYENWVAHNPIIPEGVLCLVKDRLFNGSLEYLIGDGKSTFTELMTYAGAPLSRTGKQNCSPLAAQGKDTLDPSWLPEATGDAPGAVKVSVKGATGKVPVVSNGTTLDPSWLPDATSMAKGAVKASTTQAPDAVVKADGNGSLDGWRKAFSKAVADTNAGLIVDEKTGKLNVDFSQMPVDKFNALLKGLKMQIPLEANLNMYVDNTSPNSGDTLIEERGTPEKPFNTITACVNYVTQTYALGEYFVSIFVAPSTYTETIALPGYNATTGTISIKALDYDNPPTIANSSRTAPIINATGGRWDLTRLKLVAKRSDPGDNFPYFVPSLGCQNKAIINIRGCVLTSQYEGIPHSGTFHIRVLSSSNGGEINILPMSGYQTVLTCLKNNASAATFIHAERNGSIKIYGGNIPDDGICYTIPCSGNASFFAVAAHNSNILKFFEGLHATKLTGSVTAKRYSVTSGSGILAPNGGFPGNEEGYAEASTFGWYSQ